MYNEELTEEGIVKESKDGIATIVISNSDNCKECTAKLYCKPGNSNERSLTVKDPFGVNPGDKVKISIRGSQILRISFLIYGIPLILLMVGLFFGLKIFENNKEVLSALLSFGLIAVYTLLLLYVDKKRKINIRTYPEIVFVSSK